ncbi:MAG: hypothetical protein ACLT07_06565 [Clostridia bacterium]
MLKRKLKKRGKEKLLVGIYLQMEYNGGREAETDGGLATRIDSTRVEWYYKGKDREIPFHCRDLTKGVENSILKQAKLK